MYIPIIPNIKVVNKTIVYNDTVLPLKENGDNLVITTIKNISDFSIQRCLKIIFESNPDVIFNTIQYSKQNKELYLYTNKEISLEEYEKSKYFHYEPIKSKKEILEEIKSILSQEKNKDENCVSLYEISKLLKTLKENYENVKKRYKPILEYKVQSKYNTSSSIIIYNFDYENEILEIGFKKYSFSEYEKLYLKKDENDLYILKSESSSTEEIFQLLGSELSKLYDEFVSYETYMDYKKACIDVKPVNCNFGVNISHYGISIYIKNIEKNYLKDFELYSPSYSDKYDLECNSNAINEMVCNNEELILKNIFVKIEDCPEWSQSILYQNRKEQLEKDKKNEIKLQKRLAFRRKLFPFLNN